VEVKRKYFGQEPERVKRILRQESTPVPDLPPSGVSVDNCTKPERRPEKMKERLHG